jgi:eukaryotic-like serine/threonine-protein kinase
MVVFGSGVPAEGDRIGSYLVGAKLGEGATGSVYHAVRGTDGLEVALKILKRALTNDQTYLARFRREARVATEVQHRNLVSVVEFGEDGGFVFLASEFRDGGSLADLIASEGRLPLADCKRVAVEIAAGLGALHGREILHRDVKPSNVMLDRAGSSALTDFGLARGHAYTVLTRPGQVLGTLDYLAPELIEGKEATPESDVYALGCLVYECVTGVSPFAERGVFEVAVAHLEEEPPDPRERRDAVSEQFAWALLRALEKDPAQRPPTAVAYSHLLSVATTT